MKNAISELQKDVKKHSIKGSPLLQSILSIFNENSLEGSELDVIPGSSYANSPEDITQSDLNIIFNIIVSSDELMTNNEDIASQIIAHIASFSFEYFVENLAKDLFTKRSLPLQYVSTKVSRIIVDPATGFLKNSPRSPLNDEWGDEDYKYDFFDANSPDRQTRFGKSLDKFRQMIFDQMKDFLTNDNLIEKYPPKLSVFVPSLFVSVQTTVIPPSFRIADIACGFPLRTEILLSYSKFQDQTSYSKTHDLNFKNSQTATEWSNAFALLFEETPTRCPSSIKIFEGSDCSKNIQMNFAKLILFLNLGISVQVTDEVFHNIMKFILGGNTSLAAFYIMLSQELLLVYPEFSFPLFDDIFYYIDHKIDMTNEQLFTFMLSITRFVDVLSLLPTRYLDDGQIEKLLWFTIVGLCFSDVGIRYISFKVIRSLGNFESDNKFLNLHKFIIENLSYFEQSLFYAYESHPHSILSQSKLQVLAPLKFRESLLSNDFLLWQITLSAMGIFISQQFPKEFCEMIKKNGYESLSFISKFDSNNDKYLLTFLSSLANIPYENEKDQIDNESIFITESIIKEMIKTTKNNIDNYVSMSQLYTMISPLNTSSFYLCLELLYETLQPKAVIIFLYSIVWNPDFLSIVEDSAFFGRFIDLFLIVCDSFSMIDKELMETTLDELIKVHVHSIISENDFLSSILSCFYQILNVLYQTNASHFNSPFPSTNFVVNTDDPLIVKTRKLFPLVYNLATVYLPKSNIHKYAIKTLEMWFGCNCLNDISLLCSEFFLEQLPVIGKEAPDLLKHLLSHHFDVLFATFLENALQPNGEHFFDAISSFFRADSNSSDNLPIEILKMQWNECMENYTNEAESISITKYLKPLYENSGTFILCCILYMILPNPELNDKAFITLSSLTPILLLFHMNGRRDTVTPLIETIVSICDQIGQSLSCFDSQTIYHLSKDICEHFQFCMEQLIYSMLTNIPKFDKIIIDRVLSALLPWFASIHFDIENRVISRETDLMFIRFSCFSFVEMMMSAFSEVASDDINSPLFIVWKTLATENEEDNSNFLSIVISVLYLVSSSHYHNAAYIIIRYMYQISPKIIDILSSYLSFNFSANQSYVEVSNDVQFSDVNSYFSNGSDEDESLAVIKKNDSTIIDFILKTLDKLAHDSVRPLIPFLPTIFSYCVVNLELHFKLIQTVIVDILNELQPHIENSAVPYLQEVLRIISALPIFYPTTAGKSMEELFRAENQLEQTIPRTNRSEITRAITHFFQSLSDEIAENFGFEILKWSLCCSDLYRASFAMVCYRGNLMQTNSLLIGLISRSIWTALDAITYLYNSGKDRSMIVIYARYISECYKTLRSITSVLMSNGTIGSYPMLLLIAVAGISCNVTCTALIFDAALPLLDDLLHPALFGYINGKSEFSPIHYSESTFTKYHRPWGDSFHGCARFILEYHGPNPDIDMMMSVLNNLVQDCYPLIFSESPTWMYLALLCLLPWMWSVIITDINRFFFWSPSVQRLEATSIAFSQFIQDEQVRHFFSVLMSEEEIDVFSEIEKVCSIIIPMIPTDELVLAANFFTNCLEYGQKTLKMPLYSVTTHMLAKSNDKMKIATSLHQFTDIIKKDVKASRRTYIKMYFEALNQTGLKFNLNLDEDTDTESSQINIAETQNESTIMSTSMSISMSMSTSSQFIDNDNDSGKKKKKKKIIDIQLTGPLDPQEFPSLPIFERIVAVEIPHLYDFTATEAQGITFNELNSFPPLFPIDLNIAQFEKFQNLKAAVKYIRCEPFCSWTELLSKLQTSLIETDNQENFAKRFYLSTKDKNFGQIILDVVKSLKKDEDLNDDQTQNDQQCEVANIVIDGSNPAVENLEEVYDYEQIPDQNFDDDVQMPIFDSDPFTFVYLTPKMFVPTIEQANLIGADVFDENANYQ